MDRRTFLAMLASSLPAFYFGCGDTVIHRPGVDYKGDDKVIVLGFDGLDPFLVQEWMDQGYLPNLSKLSKNRGFSDLGTSIPPQSPVAWANFINGQNPGGHGIFDFIHRDPKTYLPSFSTSKAIPPSKFYPSIMGYKLPKDGSTVNLRKGKAFWEYLGDKGIPATLFCVPSNYPPVKGPFRSLSGMGTPDLHGGYGTFFNFTENPPDDDIGGGKIIKVAVDNGKVTGEIPGPKNTLKELKEGEKAQSTFVPFEVYVDKVSDEAYIDIVNERFLVKPGEWTDWIQLEYTMVPHLVSIKGMVRFLLISVNPFNLYCSPINIDPREPAQPISTPPEYSAELAEAIGGPFHTQGIPEDTKALSGQIISNKEFMQQAWKVLEERMKIYRYELNRFNNGLLFFYFSSSDQVSHMFWRTMDPSHPAYNEEKDAPYKNTIRQVYQRLDQALGMAIKKAGDDTNLFVMSDHGFAPYAKSFHLSTWLLENGYLALINPNDRKSEFFQNVEWMGTKAYSLGLNGLYINLAGREEEGVVPASQADKLIDELAKKLEEITDPETGDKVIHKAYKTSQVYSGPYVDQAPDLIVGYNRGYRSSWETVLGAFPDEDLIRPNVDEWSGDHCMASDLVPGSLFSNRPIKLKNPKLYDVPVTILELFGIKRPKDMIGRNILTGK